MELDTLYGDVIVQRREKFTGHEAERMEALPSEEVRFRLLQNVANSTPLVAWPRRFMADGKDRNNIVSLADFTCGICGICVICG
jgi:hypothetical protein